MSLVLDNLRPEAQEQVERAARQIGVLPGFLAQRMIEAAFGGSTQDQAFLNTLQQFREADEVQRAHLAPLLRTLVVHAPPLSPSLLAGRSFVTRLPGSPPSVRGDEPQPSPAEPARPFYETATAEEWSREFQAWVDSHSDLPLLPAGAFSREADYEERD